MAVCAKDSSREDGASHAISRPYLTVVLRIRWLSSKSSYVAGSNPVAAETSLKPSHTNVSDWRTGYTFMKDTGHTARDIGQSRHSRGRQQDRLHYVSVHATCARCIAAYLIVLVYRYCGYAFPCMHSIYIFNTINEWFYPGRVCSV